MIALHLGLALFAATAALGLGVRIARWLSRGFAAEDGYDPDDGGAA